MENEKQFIFRNVSGTWQEISQKETHTLAWYLEHLNLTIDDSLQFGRFIRYFEDKYVTILYRAYNLAKVTITIYENKYE